MKPLGLVIALAAAALPAAAQEVSTRVYASRDSDSFEEWVASAGYNGASGFGLRAGGMRYRAPGWSAEGALLAGTYRRVSEERTLEASLGAARVAGRDHAVASLDLLQRLSPATSLGLSGERDYVNSVGGIDAGLTFNALALVADHAFTGRFNVGLAGGGTWFSDHNRRPHLRTRWNYSLAEDWGLNAYVKTRSYRNSNPYRAEYYSPERLNEVSLGLSSRFAVAESFVVSALVDGGRQRTELDSQPIWSYSIGLASPRAGRVRWSVALQASNAASLLSASSNYRYTSLLAQIVVPL